MTAAAGRSERERAVDLAWAAVSRRERTVAELRSLLESKRVEPDAIEAAVEELSSAGCLDDSSFARRFASDKRALDRWGSERIARDLRRRGIPPDLVERVIDDRDRHDELEAALGLLERRAAEPPLSERDRDRAWRLLVRRGYEPELAYDAVREHSRKAA